MLNGEGSFCRRLLEKERISAEVLKTERVTIGPLCAKAVMDIADVDFDFSPAPLLSYPNISSEDEYEHV